MTRQGPWLPMGNRIQAWLTNDPVGKRDGRPAPALAGAPKRPAEGSGLRLKVAAASLDRLRALASSARDAGLRVGWDWGPDGEAAGEAVPAQDRLHREPPGLWAEDAAQGQGLALEGPPDLFEPLVEEVRGQDPAAAQALERGLEGGLRPARSFRAGSARYDLRRPPYLLAILNVTRDSFYAGARHFGMDAALRRAEQAAGEGADWIEVGGESARGGRPLPPQQEADRVAPVVAALRARLDLPLAVDTYKPLVARAAVEAGATLINDISGGSDPEMFQVARESGAALVLMHLTARPKEEYPDPGYPSTVDAVRWFLGERLALAREAGVPWDQLLVDPGLNFGKHPRRDLEIMRHLTSFAALGRPIYLATSRKDYLRDLLGLKPEELLEATAAAVAFAILQGVQLFRVHDVASMARVRATVWALQEAGRPQP